jgi:hypothetical protein
VVSCSTYTLAWDGQTRLRSTEELRLSATNELDAAVMNNRHHLLRYGTVCKTVEGVEGPSGGGSTTAPASQPTGWCDIPNLCTAFTPFHEDLGTQPIHVVCGEHWRIHYSTVHYCTLSALDSSKDRRTAFPCSCSPSKTKLNCIHPVRNVLYCRPFTVS